MAITRNELIDMYGEFVNRYEISSTLVNCDFAVLPMAWEYYYITGKKNDAIDFISECREAGKKVFTITMGDFGVTPMDKDVYIFRQNGYQSRRLKYQYALPAFIPCPMQRIFNAKEIYIRHKSAKPVVGFCGQSKTNIIKSFKDVFKTAIQNVKYHSRLSFYEPHALYPSTLLRQRVLRIIEDDNRIISNFIKRKKYRAGVSDRASREKTTLEFFQNIMDSDYIVCLRGGGNFSVRLYETLAMGRIPVFVNTDCILPYDQILEWKKYTIWIEAADLSSLPDRIVSFHNSLSEEQFMGLQKKCRQLWENYLSMNGFYQNFLQNIKY